KQYKAEKRRRAVTVSAMRASPQPYWRSSVSENQFCFGINCGIYKPDIVNARSYTICWHGVVSPHVGTSGAKVCWQGNQRFFLSASLICLRSIAVCLLDGVAGFGGGQPVLPRELAELH